MLQNFSSCEKNAHCKFSETMVTFSNILLGLSKSSDPKNIQFRARKPENIHIWESGTSTVFIIFV